MAPCALAGHCKGRRCGASFGEHLETLSTRDPAQPVRDGVGSNCSRSVGRPFAPVWCRRPSWRTLWSVQRGSQARRTNDRAADAWHPPDPSASAARRRRPHQCRCARRPPGRSRSRAATTAQHGCGTWMRAQPLGGPLVHDPFVNAVAVGELQARSLVAPVVLRRRCGQTWRRRFPTRAGKLR
jgi:hypothetical protein